MAATNNISVIDSSVFVALYLPSDSLHDQAVQALSDREHHTLVVHAYVVQEVVTVLTYTSGATTANTFLQDIQKANNVWFTESQLVPEMKFFTKLKKKISFTDSTLIHLALDNQFQLLSFDKQMLAIAKQLADK